MSVPPAPPPIEQLGQRPFSFYPAILNIEHNEWLYRRATWSEILVQNTNTQVEIWVPRRYWGAISRVEEPVMIVGLTKELEYKTGAVWPAERRVIEMPRAVNEGPRAAFRQTESHSAERAPVIGIQLENRAESRAGRLLLAGVALGLAGCVLVVSLFRGGVVGGNRYSYAPVMQSALALSASDDYHAVVRALGTPEADRWRPGNGEMQYRLLAYPRQGLNVILIGRTRDQTHYAGALDRNWNLLHTVELPGHVNSASLLRILPRF
jgi:hypothetical protein